MYLIMTQARARGHGNRQGHFVPVNSAIQTDRANRCSYRAIMF
jgi:hypothetical protein